MKKILFILAALGAAFYLWRRSDNKKKAATNVIVAKTMDTVKPPVAIAAKVAPAVAAIKKATAIVKGTTTNKIASSAVKVSVSANVAAASKNKIGSKTMDTVKPPVAISSQKMQTSTQIAQKQLDAQKEILKNAAYYAEKKKEQLNAYKNAPKPGIYTQPASKGMKVNNY